MKKTPTIGILVLLLILAGYGVYDWRNGSAGIIVDSVLVVLMAIVLIKRLIGAPSETERQRQRSNELNHR